MQKRRKALLWSLIGLLFVFAVAFVLTLPRHRNNQPVYKGVTLEQWLDTVAHGVYHTYPKGHREATPEDINEAEDAIRAIGTNALPCLLEWAGYKPSVAKRRFFAIFEQPRMPGWVRAGWPRDKLWVFCHRREMLANKAVHGLRILHTNALAFEALSQMASDTNNPWQDPAAKALLTITNTPAR